MNMNFMSSIKRLLKTLTTVSLVIFSVSVFANEKYDISSFKANTNIRDVESLRRGAEFFATNCLSCHSISRVRYETIKNAMGWDSTQIKNKFMMMTGAEDEFSYVMSVSDPEIMKQAYGAKPIDLSLIARAQGPDFLMAFFKSFYVDEDSTTGSNNLAFPGAKMPDIFMPYQGVQVAQKNEEGKVIGLHLQDPGSLKPEEFTRTLNDLINFLGFVAEPNKLERLNLGIPVMIFLVLFMILSFFLYKEYWRVGTGCCSGKSCKCSK